MRLATPLAGSVILMVGFVLLGQTGCRQPRAKVEVSRLQQLSVFYGRYMSQNKGQTPTSEKQFKEFIQKVDSSVNVDELFVSPRDNEPYVVRYKEGMVAPGAVTVHEKTGVDGQRMVSLSTGEVRTVDETEFKKLMAGSK